MGLAYLGSIGQSIIGLPRGAALRSAESHFDRDNILLTGSLIEAAALAVFFYVLRGGGWHYGVNLGGADPLYRQATTACLAAIVCVNCAPVSSSRDDSDARFDTV